MFTPEDLQHEIMRRILEEEQRREQAVRRAEARENAVESAHELTHHLTREEMSAIAQSVEEEFKQMTEQPRHAEKNHTRQDKYHVENDIKNEDEKREEAGSFSQEEAIKNLRETPLTPDTVITQDSWTLNLIIGIYGLTSAIFMFLMFNASVFWGIPLLLCLLFVVRGISDKIIQHDPYSVPNHIAKQHTIRVNLPIAFTKKKREVIRIKTETIWNRRGWQQYHYHDGGLLTASYILLKNRFPL